MNPLQGFINSISQNPYTQRAVDATNSAFTGQPAQQGGQIIGQIAQGVQQNPIAKFLLGGAMNVAQDIGSGISANQTAGVRNSSDNQASNYATQLENQAQKSQNPEEKKALFEQANQLRQQIMNENQGVANTFSKDVNQNPLLRGLGAASQIVSTADMAAHPIQTVKGIAHLASGVAHAVTHPIQTAETAGNVISNLPEIASQIPEMIKGEIANPDNFKLVSEPNALTKLGSRFLAGQFKDAGNVVSDPAATMEALNKYGVNSPEDISKASQIFTGKDGVGNQIVQKALAAGGSVNLGEVVNPQTGEVLKPGMGRLAQDLINQSGNEGLSDAAAKKILQKVADLSSSTNVGGVDVPGTNSIVSNPNEAFKSLQNFEKAANMKATPGTEGAIVKSIYQNLAAELKSRIFFDAEGTGAGTANVASLITPEQLDKLKTIGNGKLANDVLNSDVLGLRQLQSHFVQGSKMVGLDAKVGEVAPNVQQAVGIAGSAISGNPIPAALAATQTKLGMRTAGNVLNTLGGLNGGSLQGGVDLAAQTLPKIMSPTGQTAPSVVNPQTASPQTQTQISSIQEPATPITTIDQIPKDISGIKPDANGNYIVANPYTITGPDGQSLIISPEAYTTQLANVKNQVAQLKQQQAQAYGDIYTQQQLQGQVDGLNAGLEALQAKKQVSDELGSKSSQTGQMNDTMSEARQLLNTAPIDILSANNSVDKLKKVFNGQYAKLAQDLDIIQKQFPGVTLFGQTKDSALTTLNGANTKMLNSFYKDLNQYVGGLSGGQNQSVAQQLPIQNQPSLPPIQQSAGVQWTGGSIPNNNLPPIQQQ